MDPVIQKIVGLFVICALHVSANQWPVHTDVQDNASYDYIIVGAGTAGSVVANRLSEQEDVEVLLIEAGDDPPDDFDISSLFVTDLHPEKYWNYESEDDGFTFQNQKNKRVNLRSGKGLGGSSTIHYLFYSRGAPMDYENWVNVTGDQSWSWQAILPYFKKSEHLVDDYILNSENARFHGQDGEMLVTVDRRNSSRKYLNAFNEDGHRIVEDLTGEQERVIGFGPAELWLSKGVRQNTAQSFLIPVKNRKNFHIMKNTLVKNILFDEHKNAVGVRSTKPDGTTVTIYAKKEIVLSAGAFNTPKLLMLSGVGPREHLEALGIPVISDLPVGKNLRDHSAILIAFMAEETYESFQRDKTHYPVPTFIGFGAIDKSQKYPDYHSHNFIFKNHPLGLHTLCSSVFQMADEICEQFSVAGQGREVLLSVFGATHLSSHGNVELRSNKHEDPLKIQTGFLSDRSDLDVLVKSIRDFTKIVNASYFHSVGGGLLDIDLPKCKSFERNSEEFWKCYVLNMMNPCYLYCCTSPMGSVLDSHLRVLGVNKLRVADASAMPDIISGAIGSAVLMIAERAADFIKGD